MGRLSERRLGARHRAHLTEQDLGFDDGSQHDWRRGIGARRDNGRHRPRLDLLLLAAGERQREHDQ